jgi:hypothetical protein
MYQGQGSHGRRLCRGSYSKVDMESEPAAHYPTRYGLRAICGREWENAVFRTNFADISCPDCEIILKQIGEQYLELNLDNALRQIEHNLGIREG